jgi:hypothetical protein
MKYFIKIFGLAQGAFAVLAYVFVCCVISSCSQDDVVPTPIEEVSVVSKLDGFTLADFPVDKVFAGEDYKSLFKEQKIGNQPSAAIVPLLFGKDGYLYTGKKYNSSQKEADNEIVYYMTDLQTFKSVTGFEYADEKYAGLIPINQTKGIWTFDPYQTSYQEKEVQTKVTLKSLSSVYDPSDFTVGDILYGANSSISSIVGHVAGVMSTFTANYCPSFDDFMASMTVSEAVYPSVYYRMMDVWWGNVSTITLLKYKNGLTSTQRSDLFNYWHNLVGEPYGLTSSLSSNFDWYCSKLMWRGYNNVLGVDIDSDGGYWCYPNDILNSNKFNKIILYN